MRHIKIGITHGDINGVGYEVIMKVLSEQKIFDGKTIIVYGSPKAAAYHRKSLALQNFNFNLITNADEAAPKRPNIIDCVPGDVKVEAGATSQEAGTAALQALETAVNDLRDGKIDLLVTMPINKESVRMVMPEFKSHTAYLAKVFGTTQHSEMYANEAIRTCYVADTPFVSQVAKSITKDAVLEKIVAMNDSLRMDFGCTKPKIAVLALNSEFGDEEKNTISQAVEEAKSSGFIVSGPFLSETFFDAAEYTRFDGVIGMYRDQVVGPFKALAFDNSISYSLGFPKICVSPALTVNYNQVDKNITEESPLAMAIFAASDLLEKREQYTELTKNQLK